LNFNSLLRLVICVFIEAPRSLGKRLRMLTATAFTLTNNSP